MASLDSTMTRHYNKAGTALFVSDDTVAGSGPVALRLRYVGTGTVTSVTVHNATGSTDIATITSDGGTDTYALATYTTLGTLADAINSAGIFEAKVVDGLRSTSTYSDIATIFLVTGAITAGSVNGTTVWDILSDTSASTTSTTGLYARLSFDRGFDKAHKSNHRVSLQEIYYFANTATTVDKVSVYEISKSGVETLVYKKPAVDNSATTINFASGVGKITAADGNDLVVRVGANDSLADGCYLQLVGEIE